MIKTFYNINFEQLLEPSNFILNLIRSNKNYIFLLTGDLGAGKTTFISYLLKCIDSNFFVQSPSYNLINEYKNNQFTFFHFDLYRIENENEIENLGFYDYWKEDNICFVEWWQNAKIYFNDISNKIEIKIEILENNNRNFTMVYE